MNIKERVEMLRSLKKEFAEKQALLAKAKKLREQASAGTLSNFMEAVGNDLEQAKLILAAKDVCDRLQKIAEHLAELGAEEIMPLADAMKGAFGPEAATTFEHAANTNIQTALETVRAAKDSINDAILQVEGKMPPQNDMSQNQGNMPPNDMAMDTSAPAMQGGVDNTAPAAAGNDDQFAGADAAAGPDSEPLGRARKESRRVSKGMIEGKSYRYDDEDDGDSEDPKDRRKAAKSKRDNKKAKDKVTEAYKLSEVGNQLLKSVTMEKLTNWLLKEAAKSMRGDQFLKFTQSVTAKALQNPSWMAGYIGEKRWGRSELSRLLESQREVPRTEKLARGIASVIETNVTLFGKGKAAQVVESFTNDLMENEGSDVLETFRQIYHSTPAMYSLRMAKLVAEDVDGATVGSAPKPELDPDEKQKMSAGIGQLASKLVANPSLASQPAINAIAGLDPNSQTALQKVVNNKSSGTVQNVGQLVKAADDEVQGKVGEASGKQNEVFKQIRSLGLLVKKDESGDYIVNYKGYKPGEGYFTDDLDDALDTARSMAKKLSPVAETKRANKGENVEDEKKGVGRAKKLKGTNAKKTIAKEELIKLGEAKIHHRSKHHHPSYLMGIGGYYAGLPRAAFLGGYAGCDPGHGCKGYDDASDHDTTAGVGDAGATVAAAPAAPVGESVKARTYEDQISSISKKKKLTTSA